MPQDTRNLVAPLSRRYGLPEQDIEQCARRLCRGLETYGPTNHLRPGFDAVTELLEELQDSFNMAGPIMRRRFMLARLGKLPARDLVGADDNPVRTALLEHIASAIRLARELQQQQEPDQTARIVTPPVAPADKLAWIDDEDGVAALLPTSMAAVAD